MKNISDQAAGRVIQKHTFDLQASLYKQYLNTHISPLCPPESYTRNSIAEGSWKRQELSQDLAVTWAGDDGQGAADADRGRVVSALSTC